MDPHDEEVNEPMDFGNSEWVNTLCAAQVVVTGQRTPHRI
jgi:hypothetical protein